MNKIMQKGWVQFSVMISESESIPEEVYEYNKLFLSDKSYISKVQKEMEKGRDFKMLNIKTELIGDEHGGKCRSDYSYILFSFDFENDADMYYENGNWYACNYYHIDDMRSNFEFSVRQAFADVIPGYNMELQIEVGNSVYDTEEEFTKKYTALVELDKDKEKIYG